MNKLDWILKNDETFRYQMLSRLKMDCEYYLGNGGKNPDNLWAGEEKQQIEVMKAIWNSFHEDEKPEWLTWENILEYEKKMVLNKNIKNVYNHLDMCMLR